MQSTDQLRPGATYTFYFQSNGAIVGVGDAPSGPEVATVFAQGVLAISDVSVSAISQYLGFGLPQFAVTFVYSGDGTDTVGSLAAAMTQAYDDNYYTTTISFASATGGYPGGSSSSGSTWLWIGLGAAALLALILFLKFGA